MKAVKVMMTKQTSVAALLVLGLVSGGLAVAAPALATPKLPPASTVNGITTQTASANDLFQGLQKFLNLPASDRSQVNVFYRLRIKHCDASQVSLSMNAGGQTIPMRIAADGRVTPLPTREQLNSGASVTISGPEACSVNPKIVVYSPQPSGRTYDAAGLTLGVKQGNAAMSKIAGVLALGMAKLDRAYFVGGGSGTVTVGGQSKPLPRTTATGEYPAGTPYFVPSDMDGATSISLSATPSVVLFDTPPK
ncbi:MAG TPA: hypothetical protein VG839_06610 [Asticcacaulis sp.]|nr:hypothetical protein [Asticcacaulis sp.]